MHIQSENFPGMGSNNHIATGRYLKCMGILLNKVQQKPPTVFPPDTTQHTWNKSLNKEWLKLRELDTEGNAVELRERVHTYMNSTNCPGIAKSRSVSIQSLQRMYASTYNALSHLMSESSNDTHARVCYIHVKRLLNDIEAVDQVVRGNEEKPVWHQKYNLLCLLNCKEDMQRYGPARGRWEGDVSGEKNIQFLKDGFKGFHTNWVLNTHKSYFINKTMTKLEKNRQDYIGDSNSKKMKKYSVLHVYTSPQEASSAYLLGKPLCIVRMKDTREFGVLHTLNRFWKLKNVKFESQTAYVCLFKLELYSNDITSMEVTEDRIENVCIAIPYDGSYVILDMEWKELDSNMEFVYGYK